MNIDIAEQSDRDLYQTVCELEAENDQLKACNERLRDTLVRLQMGDPDICHCGESMSSHPLRTTDHTPMAIFDSLIADALDEIHIQSLAEHDASLLESLMFPTMLRKMWSGGDVQAWLSNKAANIRQQALENK